MATDIEASFQEKGRLPVLAHNVLPHAFLEGLDIHALALPDLGECACHAHRDATRFGAGRELCTTSDYTLSGRWAAAFDRDGFPALAYASRYTTDPEWNALAWFGADGKPSCRPWRY